MKKLLTIGWILLLSFSTKTQGQNYTVTDLGTLGGNESYAYGINNSGQIAGYAQTIGNTNYHAFLYSNGSMQDLGTLGGSYSRAYGINDNGQVVGLAYISGNSYPHAFLYSDDLIQDIGILMNNDGTIFSTAYGINDNGQIIGSINTSGSIISEAFLYSNGSVQHLGVLAGGNVSIAYGINNNGQMVGYSLSTNNVFGRYLQHAFLYSNGLMQDLDTSDYVSFAYGINDNGQVVGSIGNSGGDNRAFLYSGDTMQSLSSLIIPVNSGWVLQGATAINNAGQIVGYGTRTNKTHAFLLNPLPSAPIITTLPQSQTVQVGSNVIFTIVANGSPSPNYQWRFNGQNLAGQTAANLSLTNVQFANVGGYSVIVTNAYGSATSAVAQLTVFTNLVLTQTNKAPPPPGSPTIPTDALHFRVFTNSGFVSGMGLDTNKSTIVLTHGWNNNGCTNGCSASWPLDMAKDIKFQLGSSTPNIVAWDWTTEAAGPLPTAAFNTQGQGYALGTNLAAALGANYSKRIHFIGHSLGTLVNAKAANYIHTNGFSWTNTHMTLLDEAEVAWGTVSNTWQTVTSLLQNDSNPQQDWKHPLPDQCAWADNYITAFGMPHPQAVNVILTNLAPDVSNIQNIIDFGIGLFWTDEFKTEITAYHNYPFLWYDNTINQINNPNDPPYLMGFLRSWEGGGSYGRPSTNTYYIESTNCHPSFLSYSGYDPAYNLVRINSDEANQFLNARLQNLISQVGVNLVSSTDNILANAPSQAQAILQSGQAWNPFVTVPFLLQYKAAIFIKLKTVNAIDSLALNRTVQPLGGPAPGPSGTNVPAYVWIPVTVPSNAVLMSFNFMLEGNGNQDSFQAALNNNNLMTVETVLIQTNVTMNSGMFDVSQYAGQQAELFFGIIGGTSTNAVLTVSDIAFYVTLPPTLQIQLSGTNVVVTWPLSAAGFVLETTDKLTTTDSWTTVTNVPAIVNFQYTVTNQISGSSRFYRLAMNSAPALQAQVSGSSFVLSWPASAQNFSLQTTTNLVDPNSWMTVTDTPAVVNLQCLVTNQISGAARFYRLKK
jgi:probable HAF family extracellular repeat protein